MQKTNYLGNTLFDAVQLARRRCLSRPRRLAFYGYLNPRPLIEIDRYGQRWIGCSGENACGTPMQWVPIDLEILDSPGSYFR